MAYAKHIIQRQVIELQLPDSMDRLAVQNQVSGIFRQQVLPLLDELLSRKSATATLIIDRLELDIGSLPVTDLEQALAKKIMAALQEKLEQVTVPPQTEQPLVDRPTAPQQQSHTPAELVLYFLQTGSFPWWAQETTYAYLEAAIQTELLRKNTGFKQKLTPLLQTEATIKRLVHTFGDALLEQVVQLYATAGIKLPVQQKELLFELFTGKLTRQQLRVLWWAAIFQTATGFPFRTEKEWLEKAGWQFVKEAAQQAEWSALIQWCNQLEGKSGVPESVSGFVRLAGETGAEQQLQKERTDDRTVEKTDGKQKEEAKPDTAASPLQPHEPEPVQSNRSKNDVPEEVKKENAEKTISRLSPSEEAKVSLEITPQRIADIDKLYIQNAGLVLLWPFLHRFFQHTQLADNKTFLNEPSAERACLLLQYLTTGKAEELFEAQLPLNKMLCGIPLLQPVDTQWHITDTEIAEAENFLLAVIQNGGAGWKNLSVNGLRQAYLLRDGILSSRDGAWLLQVERKPYDVLIGQLPWSVNIVKLPWMKGLVFVEW